MRKYLLPFLLIPGFAGSLNAQQIEKPKLVVMMVVDQMRSDYVSRYWSKFGEGGFKRIVKGGYNNKNANYNYFPTYTAAGHASISTGSVPSINGIVGNDWYDKNKSRSVYCTEDENVETVGSESIAGLQSATNLMATTVGDELRLATNFRSKVIGIALKDRAAILTAGHNASGVYWFDESNGSFISSTYYTKNLPAWLVQFNDKKLTEKYLSEKWETTLPIVEYANFATADNVPYEGKFNGEQSPVFPHDIPAIRKKENLGLIRSTPNGNRLTFDLAKAAIEGEALGTHETSDLLNVSFSSPDYIGHQFGPRSIEVADMYIKFDNELQHFFEYLDKKVGKDNYVICITADHGAADNPNFLKDHKFPGGYSSAKIKDSLNIFLKSQFGVSPVAVYKNQQFYLDQVTLTKNKLNSEEVVTAMKTYLMKQPYVLAAYSKEQIMVSGNPSGMLPLLQNGFYFQRCGDVTVVFNNGYLGGPSGTGTTHGSTYRYDTNVPLLWYGKVIKNETDFLEVKVSDIAPTLSAILDIQAPSGNVGTVIKNIFK
ncbi:alkaline phosphatase family protein [Pedobacter chinensis]|uniref:glycerophosphocholine cholinephosphodiesterase n=1 Tax=Pedobacter chinensis TaxID=2282421 RepID=A0A369PZA0_9SPHI|nr:alkaline phosphatase PafA [Pedobacter chinensis]RDC57824.1 alkaline phosphatase family protein [Pedobacter chinensis]